MKIKNMFSELLKYPKTFGSMDGDNGGFAWWHKGRSKYCVWVIEPDLDPVTKRFRDAQQHLSPYLIPNYQRKVHITLGQAGFWSEDKIHVDDYLMDDLIEDLEKLQRIKLKVLQCCMRNILISYAIAPGFEILDEHQHLASMNQLICRGEHDENFVYFPHITTGLYNGEWDTSFIAGELAKFPIEDNIPLSIDKIKLISYAPAISGGALEDELVFDVKEKKVTASRYPV